MANSKYEYVRSFEQQDVLLPETWIVVRIDGRGFSKLTAKYKFVKPNDRRALDLMNAAAEAVMKELPDLVLAYGNSDEFSFVFHKDCNLFERRASKLTSTVVSTFTAHYVYRWPDYFPETELTLPLPSFDGRAVCYPSDAILRDYMSWRQVDCHINNLYNTTFWALVQQGGMEPRAAEQELSGTVSSDKNEILFSRFGINYNNEPEIFKKGSVLYRDLFPTSTQSSPVPPRTAQSPPLTHTRPQRSIPRPMSQPLERTLPDLFRDSPASGNSTVTTPRGPTFLSTSTTPSPPPSPPAMSIPTVSNPLPTNPQISYPQTFVPVAPPQNGSASRQPLPMLTPLPLPPPTLKPSTRPPPSLNPPNPTAHTNTSPLPSPEVAGPSSPIPKRTTSNPTSNLTSRPNSPPKAFSHSASASLSRPTTGAPPASKPAPKRSPSLSILEVGPPQIPLRISSIPMNAKPRKLSLPSQKSCNHLNSDEKENAFTTTVGTGIGAKVSPPPHLQTMKELPSPPVDDIATRHAVMGSEPPQWTSSPPASRESNHGKMETVIPNPVIPLSPPPVVPSKSTQRRARSHSRLNSAPPSSYLPSSPPALSKDQQEKYRFAGFDWTPAETSAKGDKKKGKAKVAEEEGGWAAGTKGNEGRPPIAQMSKTQREKERKKRTKARIVTEHVDIIKDEFWEKRPWILSGKTG